MPRRWTAEEEAFEEMLDHERYMALDNDLREEDFRKGKESVTVFVCLCLCVRAHAYVCMCVFVCVRVHRRANVCLCMHACEILTFTTVLYAS